MKEINKNSIDELLIRYLTGIATKDEMVEAEKWMNSNDQNQAYFEKFKSVWEMSSKVKEYHEIDTESSLKSVKQRIDFGKQSNNVRLLYVAMRIAAVLIIAFGLFFIFKDNESISNANKMVMVESFETLKIVSLPDGSVVTLNAASHIEYPEKFEGNERRIKFEGEAYFEVAPNKTKPFIIETEKSETKVVGTAFNLRAISGAKVESIVVTEGIVEFSGKTETTVQPVTLVKGEKAVLSSELKKEENTDRNFMAWKTGVLLFENDKLTEALKLLSDFYQLEFKIKDSVLNDYTISGRYEKKLRTEELPGVLEMVLEVNIEKQGEIYWLKKKTN